MSAPQPTEGAPGDPQELANFVQGLMTQMQTRFEAMAGAILGRIDDMGSRIDDLEKSIAELTAATGGSAGVAAKTPASAISSTGAAGDAAKAAGAK